MLDIISKINIKKIPQEFGRPVLKGAIPVPLSAENFHPLEEIRGKKVGFVDGGNNIIFLSPSQAIHLLRLYYSIFKDGKKVEYGRYTFILNSFFKPTEDLFYVEIYDVDSSGLLPQSMNITIDEIDEREKIKGIGAYVRRIGEWILLEKLLGKCDVIVRDGALQTGERKETLYANKLFDNVRDEVIIGFSKTCSLVTDGGYSLLASIHYLSKKHGIMAPWYYNPIAKNINTIKGDMFVVKLHPYSDYVFRVEIYPEDRAQMLGSLIPMANDPIFIGYPYGLIDADVNARITDEEARMYKEILYNSADDFTRMQANAMNSHDIISGVK
jgi:hypothetical protein